MLKGVLLQLVSTLGGRPEEIVLSELEMGELSVSADTQQPSYRSPDLTSDTHQELFKIIANNKRVVPAGPHHAFK